MPSLYRDAKKIVQVFQNNDRIGIIPTDDPDADNEGVVCDQLCQGTIQMSRQT